LRFEKPGRTKDPKTKQTFLSRKSAQLSDYGSGVVYSVVEDTPTWSLDRSCAQQGWGKAEMPRLLRQFFFFSEAMVWIDSGLDY
jgi:hypothetical protein